MIDYSMDILLGLVNLAIWGVGLFVAFSLLLHLAIFIGWLFQGAYNEVYWFMRRLFGQ